MKIIFSFSAFFIFIGCAAQTSHESTWEVYENILCGIALSYPAHWDTTNQDSRIAFMAVEINEDTLDRFNENLNLVITKSNGATLESALDQNYAFAKKHYGDSITLKRGLESNRNGVNLGYISLVHEVQGMELNQFSYLFSDGIRLYCLTIGGEQKKEPIYGKIREKIVQNIKFIQE